MGNWDPPNSVDCPGSSWINTSGAGIQERCGQVFGFRVAGLVLALLPREEQTVQDAILGHLHLKRAGSGVGDGSGKEGRLQGPFPVIQSLNRSCYKSPFFKIGSSGAQRGSFLLLL